MTVDKKIIKKIYNLKKSLVKSQKINNIKKLIKLKKIKLKLNKIIKLNLKKNYLIKKNTLKKFKQIKRFYNKKKFFKINKNKAFFNLFQENISSNKKYIISKSNDLQHDDTDSGVLPPVERTG